MPLYKISFSVVGSTHTIIEADDEEDAAAIFEKGQWVAANPHFESYEVDETEIISPPGG